MADQSDPGGPDLSVVLPIHNQAGHIEGLLAGYLDLLDRLSRSFELVLVPNACTDGSEVICRDLARRDRRVVVVELKDGGWGRAVRAGLARARGNHLCYTNSARTSPEALALVLSYALAYPEVLVKVNRRTRDSLRRRLGSLFYNLECRALFDLPVWDVNGTPKVYPRSFDRLTDLRSNGDLIDAELMARSQAAGYPVVEVPLLSTDRHGGKSTTGYASALKMYVGALRLKRILTNE